MAQIAQKLGVATSTISRALRGNPRIGEEMRKSVAETARKLGYRPNPLVSALMANRRRRGGKGEVDVIALVTSYGGRHDWRAKEVCRWEFDGIQRRASALGFRIEVFPLPDYRGDASRLEATLRARGIRGVLMGFSREEAGDVSFRPDGFAIAGLSGYFRSAVLDRANFHGFFNVQLALEQMARLGYRRPGLVVPELSNQLSNNHWSGAFLDWQRRLPEGDRCEPFIPAGEPDAAEFNKWLDRNRPDALLVYKITARGFLARRGLRVPNDIGLAYLYRTSHEIDAAAGIDGNLSSVGAAAVELVVEKLNTNSLGVSDHTKEVLIKGSWHDGPTLPARASPSRETAAAQSRSKARGKARR